MATKTIGATARDYATLALWASYIDGLNVLAAAEFGECYNDSEFTSTAVLCTITGVTPSSSFPLTLRCGSGQSFKDNANKATNALKYNASNGVGIRVTSNYSGAINVDATWVTLEGLQVAGDGSQRALDCTTVASNNDYNQCIFESGRVGSTQTAVAVNQSTSKIRNSLVVCRSSASGVRLSYSASAYNVTVARPSDVTASGDGFLRSYGTPLVENCAVFGFSNFSNPVANFSASSSNGCTDLASTSVPGSANQVSKTYANQFQNTADATRDFRLKTGADCIDNGATDSTNGATDIIGTSRPSGAAYDIGAWEFVAAATGGPFPMFTPPLHGGMRELSGGMQG